MSNEKKSCNCCKNNLEIAEEVFNSDKYCAVLVDFKNGKHAILGHNIDGEQEIINALLKVIERLNNK